MATAGAYVFADDFPPGDHFYFQQTVIYTASGTFVKASYPGLAKIRVRLVGGGGPGGPAAATAGGQMSVGGGGEGGCYAQRDILEAALATSETVTVGAAGTTAGSTDAASTSSFGTLVVGPGGEGGVGSGAGSTVTLADGGESTQTDLAVGDIVIPGGRGGRALRNGTTFSLSGAGGGAAPFGSGGPSTGTVSSSVAATAARGYGGGGGGAVNGPSQSAQGAAGSRPGLIVVEIYVA